MQRFLSVVISLVIVAVSAWIGTQVADFTQAAIRLVLPLPDIDLDATISRAAMVHLLVAGLIAFAIAAFFLKDGLFATAARTAKQVYFWGAAWGVGSLYLFLMSSNVFPHDILVGAFVIGIVLFWLGYAIFGRDRDGIVGRFLSVIGATFKLLLKPLTWLALLITITPLIAAAAYVVSQDFRDAVAEFRVKQNVSVEGDWMTVPINTKTQLLQPIMARFEPGDDTSLYVLERAGRLYRMRYPDDGTKELVIDFAERVGEVNLENGALGFDFDPKWGEDGRRFVYVYYTSYGEGKQVNYLSRFDLSAADPAARVATRYDMIEIPRPPTQYHNGGHVEIGPDGFLYLSVGEMELPDAHQRVDKQLVSGIFRIDVLEQGGDVSMPIANQQAAGKTQGYYIPRDNPFVGEPGALGEFYALGLRNPFRFHHDAETGLLWTGEVGSNVWEEVNAVAKGGNYQYPYNEGGKPTSFKKPGKVVGKETGPVYTYQHTAYDRSVIGGIVYRGTRWPDLTGKYIFGDNYSGTLWAMPAVNQKVATVEVLGQATKFAQRGFTSIIEAPDGRILITLMGSSSAPNGEIAELVTKEGGVEQSIGGGGAAAAAAGADELTEASIRESYVTNCARCHGETGYGDGPDKALMREAWGVEPTNFHTPEFKAKDRAEIVKAIREGGGAVGLSDGMPPWTGVLEDKEMEAIADYVRAMPSE
ncbi:MAG: PQQ-dependent sugar dehydrogenase [Sphingomonadaceae bacterium]